MYRNQPCRRRGKCAPKWLVGRCQLSRAVRIMRESSKMLQIVAPEKDVMRLPRVNSAVIMRGCPPKSLLKKESTPHTSNAIIVAIMRNCPRLAAGGRLEKEVIQVSRTLRARTVGNCRGQSSHPDVCAGRCLYTDSQSSRAIVLVS